MKTPDFCLKFRVFERASWDLLINTNMAKKSDWYAAQRISNEALHKNRATICYECLKRSEMYVKKLVKVVPLSHVIIS